MAGAQGLELLSKRKRAIGEIRCRNIEQHWEGNSVILNLRVYSPSHLWTSFQKGWGKARDLISMAQGIDLNSLVFGPAGVDQLLQHSNTN